MSPGKESEFARLLEEEARDLASYVLALVGNRHLADDLFQSACLELWRLRDRFESGTDFGAWARSVARYQVLRHWRKASREKVSFSSAAVERIEAAYAESTNEAESAKVQRKALEACLEMLSGSERELLRRRYQGGVSVRGLAAETGRTENAIKMALVRLRQKLGKCVRSRIVMEASSHE